MTERTIIGVQAESGASLPTYGSSGASGADVRAFIEESFELAHGQIACLSTGLKFDIPEGYEIQVRSRSGLAAKHGIAVLNSPGTVDWDYRGELKIILINHSKESFTIEPGMRIAQIVVAPMMQADFRGADALTETARGSGGFGHTGLK